MRYSGGNNVLVLVVGGAGVVVGPGGCEVEVSIDDIDVSLDVSAARAPNSGQQQPASATRGARARIWFINLGWACPCTHQLCMRTYRPISIKGAVLVCLAVDHHSCVKKGLAAIPGQLTVGRAQEPYGSPP